jgi:hypothetical protein
VACPVHSQAGVLLFAVGLIVGLALGMVIVGLLAVGAYDHGFLDALERRQPWRAELKARRVRGMREMEKRAS